jgi:hypothetical protein
MVWRHGGRCCAYDPDVTPEEEAVAHVPVQTLDESQLQAPLDDEQVGQVYAVEQPDGSWEMSILARAGLAPEQAEGFERWARTALAQVLMTNDPHGNGWYRSSLHPNTWHMTARSVHLPPLDSAD